MKWILFLGCISSLLAGAATLPPPSEPASSTTAHEPERYLFLVETSTAMKRFDQTSRQALFDLVHWGVDRHMEGGDTYGIWTFNEDAHIGQFPMQVWDPDLQLMLGTKASVFLKDQPYEGNTQMSRVILKLLSVIMTVKDVNVVIITDGASPMAGLPFDQEIQAEFARKGKEARRVKKPFLLTLIAREGEVVQWNVTLPGDPIPLPQRRARLEPLVAAVQPRPGAALVRPTPPAAPKPKGQLLSLKTADNEPGVAVAIPNAAPPAPNTTATVQTIPQPLAPTPALPVTETVVVENRPAPPAPTPTVPLAQKYVRANSDSDPVAEQETQTPHRKEVPPAAAALDQAAATVALTRPRTQIVEKVPAVTVAAREPGVVPIAVALPPHVEPILSARELFIAGAVLLLAAAGLIFVLLRRAQPPSHGSYITRSMDDRS